MVQQYQKPNTQQFVKSKMALIDALVVTYIICEVPSQQFKRNISQRNTPGRLLSIMHTDDNGLCGKKNMKN